MSLMLMGMSGSEGGGAEDVPNRSLDFTAANTEYLELSNANWGAYNRALWAFSCWAQRKSSISSDMIFSKGVASTTTEINIKFDVGQQITVETGNVTTNGVLTTPSTFTPGQGYEAGGFYHIYVTFNAAADEADRLQLIVDGTRVTTFNTETQPVGNIKTTTGAARMGLQYEGSSAANAYIYQPAFFSGVIPDVGDLISGGLPRDLRGASGLYSLLHTTDSSTLEDDEVKAANWTNNNTVVKSEEVPS